MEGKLHVPDTCSDDNIPEYLVELYMYIIQMVGSYLSTMKQEYVVLGGRAFNAHSDYTVPSLDWDVAVKVGHINSRDAAIELLSVVHDCEAFLRSKLMDANTKSVFGVEFKTRVNTSMLAKDDLFYQLGLVDPYTDSIYYFMDVHNCNEDVFSCDTMTDRVNVDGIWYASKERVKQDIAKTYLSRRRVFLRTSQLQGELERDYEAIYDTIVDGVLNLKHVSKTDARDEHVDKVIELLEQYHDLSEAYRYSSLKLKDGVKYLKTKSRYGILHG